MDAEEYLDRGGVTAYLKDVVTLLLENQPANPIAFLAQYFRQVTQGSTPLLRAYRYIRLAEPEQDSFGDNLVSAFDSLAAGQSVEGVAGEDLVRLLRLLGADSALDISRALLALVDKTEGDHLCFSEFAVAVRACLQYNRFFRHAETLFTTCQQRSGAMPRWCLELTQQELGGAGSANLEREVQREVERWGQRAGEASVTRGEFLRALFTASTNGHANAGAAVDLCQVVTTRQAAADVFADATDAALGSRAAQG
ncbi:hypothetical protein AB1Y20_023567 [Prymnesium parvum]